MRHLAITLCCMAIVGCHSGGSPMPEGFNEACYGGDFSTSLAGSHPIYSAELDIPDSSWPELKESLLQLAKQSEVKAFDEGRDTQNLKMFSMYLCSEDGLFSIIDKRIWQFPGKEPHGLPTIQISVYSYKENDRWNRLANDLDTALREQWPDQLHIRSTTDSRLLNSTF